MKKIFLLSKPGVVHNEDIGYVSEEACFILDGATGLLKENITGDFTDACWFVKEWGSFLVKNLPDTTKSIQEIIKLGVKTVNKKYMNFPNSDKVVSKPSASACVFRKNKDMIEYIIFGDCSLFVEETNGKCYQITTENLSALDSINIQLMVKIAKEKGINVCEARALINESLLKTRLSENTEGGYYNLADYEETAYHTCCGELNPKDIKKIIGTSDGFSQIYDTIKKYTLENFIKSLNSEKSLEKMHNELFLIQEEDDKCNKYPRFKKHDDSSAFIYFEKDI